MYFLVRFAGDSSRVLSQFKLLFRSCAQMAAGKVHIKNGKLEQLERRNIQIQITEFQDKLTLKSESIQWGFKLAMSEHRQLGCVAVCCTRIQLSITTQLRSITFNRPKIGKNHFMDQIPISLNSVIRDSDSSQFSSHINKD